MKKFAALLLCAMMVLALALPAAAQEEAPLLKGDYTVADKEIVCVGLPIPGGETITVTADALPYEHVTFSTMEKEEMPITFVCVTDLSKNFTKVQREQMTTALQAISSAMRPIDSMMILGMGNKLTINSPLTTAQEREQAITGSWPYANVTYINTCVTQMVDELTVPGKYTGNMCIIILSDGVDDLSSPQQHTQAVASVKTSGLNVNTIALVDSIVTPYARNQAVNLTDFAQASVNGMHFAPILDAITAEDAAKQIVQTALNAPVLRIDGSHLDHSGGDVYLEATCETDDVIYSGTVTVTADDVASIPAYVEETLPPETTVPETTVPETTVPETTEPATEEAKSSILGTIQGTIQGLIEKVKNQEISYLLIAGVAAAALGVILLISAIVVWARSGKKDDDEEEDEDDMVFMDDDASLNADAIADMNFSLDALDSLLASFSPSEEAVPAAGRTVRLLEQPSNIPTKEFFLPEREEKSFGRNLRSDFVLNGEDTNLSSLHFSLIYTGGELQIRDCGSTNGTKVGGKQLKPDQWTTVAPGAVITAGSFEYTLEDVSAE